MTVIYIWLSTLTFIVFILFLAVLNIINQQSKHTSIFQNISKFCEQQGEINKEIGTTMKAMSNNLTAINKCFIGDTTKK